MDDSLQHYGVRGMKWGVRRFQDKSGRLTPAGKKRYGSSYDLSDKTDAEMIETVKRKNLEKSYRKAIKDDDDRLEKAKKTVDASKSTADSLRDLERKMPANKNKKPTNLDHMSDQELRSIINRKLLEKQYNDLHTPENQNKGREYARTALDITGAVLGVTSSALGIAIAIKNLRG